jgi:hypothetical protein
MNASRVFPLALLLLLSVLGFPALAQTTVTLQDGLNGYVGTADNHTFDSQPTVNNGNNVLLLIGHNTNMGLIRFPIFAAEGGPVPDGATITSATLSLYKSTGPDAVLRFQRVLKSWHETQSSWNMANSSTAWEVPGAKGATDVGTIDFEGSIGAATNAWVNIDVSAAVQAFAATSGSNHGWRVAYVSGGTGTKEFISRNNTSSTLRPKLTITYASGSACTTGSLRPYDGAPINGTPIAVSSSSPTEIEAEHFNCGGQNVAYFEDAAGDNNATDSFRTEEAVDTIAAGSGHAVNHFNPGEWMIYTINVAAAGQYDLSVFASSGWDTGVFKVLVDDVAVTGDVGVSNTGGWETYDWRGNERITLAAGQHQLKIQSVANAFRFDKLRLTPVSTPMACNTGSLRPYDQSPVNGNPIAIGSSGATFEAEHFNCGGQNVAYFEDPAGDNNTTDSFRTDELVDTIAAGSGHAVNHFNPGEWMIYTVNVAQAGDYNFSILAATGWDTGAYRVSIDGNIVLSNVAVSNTGSWETYTWQQAASPVALTAGTHQVRIEGVANAFRVDKLRFTTPSGPDPDPTICPAGNTFCGSFENGSYQADGFGAQLWTPERATIVSNSQVPGIISGTHALRLETRVGECGSQIRTTCPWERAELTLTHEETGATEGGTQWWAQSFYTPGDFHLPESGEGGNVVMQLHAWNSDPSGNPYPDYGSGQPNVSIEFVYGRTGTTLCPASGSYNGPVLYVRGSAGGNLNSNDTTRRHIAEQDAGCRKPIFDVPLVGGQPRKELWYDLVHQIKWASSSNTGFHYTWLRVRDAQGNVVLGPTRVMTKNNIYTKYPQKPVYFKAGTYHDGYGVNSAIVQDRIVRGNTFSSVAPFACPAGDSLCQ